MDEIKFSVIIPHYQDLDRIPTMIRSIPPYDDIQVIIVDDNSYTDRTIVQNVISGIGRKNVELFFNESGKQSAGAARNEGLKHAKGKWLIFGDSDDWYPEGAFDVFNKHYDDKEDIIYFLCSSVNLKTNQYGTRHCMYNRLVRRYLNREKFSEADIRYTFFSPTTKMIRHSMVQEHEIRFDASLAANDVNFSTKCGFYAKEISAYREFVYIMTRHPGSLTTTKNTENFKARVAVLADRCKFLSKRLSPIERCVVIPRTRFNTFNGFLHYGFKTGCFVFWKFLTHGMHLWYYPAYYQHRRELRKINEKAAEFAEGTLKVYPPAQYD